MRSQRLTLIIFVGMLLGIAVGYGCNKLWPDPPTANSIAGYISLPTDTHPRLITITIPPLIFPPLVDSLAPTPAIHPPAPPRPHRRRRDRGILAHHPEDHRLHHGAGAYRGVRGDGGDNHDAGDRRPLHLRQIPG